MLDFTQIKLSIIYYHLEKMQSSGYLNAYKEKDIIRPEKTVYTITDKGKVFFQSLLKVILNLTIVRYSLMTAFLFFEMLSTQEITAHLKLYIERLYARIDKIQKHKTKTLN